MRRNLLRTLNKWSGRKQHPFNVPPSIFVYILIVYETTLFIGQNLVTVNLLRLANSRNVYSRVVTSLVLIIWVNLYADCHKRDLCHKRGPVDDFFCDSPWVSQDLLSLMQSLSQTFCDNNGIPKLSRFISGALR